MNSAKRPGGGRPNRGGGRGRGRGRGNAPPPKPPSQPRHRGGASAGGGGRKGGSRNVLDEDYDDGFEVYNPQDDYFDEDENDYYDQGKGGATAMPSAAGSSGGGAKGAEAPKEKRKVEMQVLHMSDDSQAKIEKALFDLYGGQHKMRDAKSYKDSGRGLDRRFWVRDRQLFVQGVDTDGSKPGSSAEVAAKHGLNGFALVKLESFGFHQSRCIQSLKDNEGDVGRALEKLMSDCFDLGLDEEPSDIEEDLKEMYREQKEDEKMALESIYGEGFAERVPGKVWEIKLALPGMDKFCEEAKVPTRKKTKNEMGKDVCRFYLNGYCKFGFKCRQRHVQPEKLQNVDDKHLRKPREENLSLLEIRFPSSKPHYPIHPPVVVFSTPISRFPKWACLNLTKRLMDEAKSLCKDEVPSVFTLVSLLENEETIKSAVETKDQMSFSYDEDLVPAGLEEAEKQAGNSDRSMHGNLDLSGNNLSEEEMKKNFEERQRKEKLKMLDENNRIRRRFANKKEDPKMMEQRRSLPAWNEQEKILDVLKNNQIVVISGMTGCGKSTQVPQYILDDWMVNTKGGSPHCNVICTQPRRISAMGVAERVASERNEKVGNVVGYQIRLESKTSAMTRLLFCTTGILLRRLESDPDMALVTHVIVDEVHERSEESDFLLMILKGVARKRPDLRVILMSATLNASLFSKYFGSGIPILEIPGRTFPVEQIFLEDVITKAKYVIEDDSQYAKRVKETHGSSYLKKEQFKGANMKDVYIEDCEMENLLIGNDENSFKPPKDNQRDEDLNSKQIYHRYNYAGDLSCRTLSRMDFEKIDYDLIESTLLFIADGQHNYPKTGSILVFLPGMGEIMTLFDQINNHPLLGSKAGRFQLVPLHSSLSSEEQALVFSKPKGGVRKIVISTNLAETSITIDDCVFVVEAGRMKEKHFDSSKNMESLETVWISQANGLQRKGRAGRVMPGVCFHLYTKFRFDYHLRKDPIPEIQRIPLEAMVLRIKILPLFKSYKVVKVLNSLIEPPDAEAMNSAIARLKGVGALDTESNLTPLGYHLAGLPVDVRIGKLMLFGCVFRCMDSALTIAAALSYRSPFLSPFGKREEAMKRKKEFATRNSDHLAILRAYQSWHDITNERGNRAGYNYAQERFLSQKTLHMLVSMKHQYLELLSGIGFGPSNISMRSLTRQARNGGDAVVAATGPEYNVNNNNHKLVVAVLCAALYPNIVQMLSPELRYKQTAAGAMFKAPEAHELKFKTKSDGYVNIHPSSVNFSANSYENPYLVYHEKIKTSRVFIRELSMVPLFPMILFGGTGVELELQRGNFVLNLEDGWIKFVTANHKIAELLKEIRFELDLILEEKIKDPSLNLVTYARGKLVIDTIVSVISKE